MTFETLKFIDKILSNELSLADKRYRTANKTLIDADPDGKLRTGNPLYDENNLAFNDMSRIRNIRNDFLDHDWH